MQLSVEFSVTFLFGACAGMETTSGAPLTTPPPAVVMLATPPMSVRHVAYLLVITGHLLRNRRIYSA